MCSHYNLDFIKAQDLANWAEGLEPPLNCYAQSFLDAKVGPLSTMALDEDLISTSVVSKIGHLINLRQKLLCLIKVMYDIKDETVSSLVMKYQSGARSLETIIARKSYEFVPQRVHSATRATVPNNVLSQVCEMLATGREICTWLIKPPFSENKGYLDLAEFFWSTNKDIGYSIVGDRWTETSENELTNHCKKIQTFCRNFVDDCTDSSIINPAFLEQVKLKRASKERIGIIFKLSMEGIHTISGIRENTPASRCNKLSIMDEIVQIDYTCVTNWTLESIMNKFKQANNNNEVCLTLRKRPRNMSLNIHLRRMKVLVPPDAKVPLQSKPAHRRSRKSTTESVKQPPNTPSSVPVSMSPKKTSIESGVGSSRQSFLNHQDSRSKNSEAVASNPRGSVSRNSLSSKLGSRKRSVSASSLLLLEPNDSKPVITVAKAPAANPVSVRQQVLPSVSSCDPSTSSGALSSSDQDSAPVFQTPAPVQQEKHAVIDRRVSIKDLGETEISGNLQRKKADNEWISCYCVIKNGYFYVFASSDAEKADVVVHLKAVDVAKSDEQDNFKFVFTMQFAAYQQKRFTFAAANRSDLGHWVNNLHTAKLLLGSKKPSVVTRNLLAVDSEIEESPHLSDVRDDKVLHESSENFSETDDECDDETSNTRFNLSSDIQMESYLLRSSFLNSSVAHSTFSRSSTLEEPSNALGFTSVMGAYDPGRNPSDGNPVSNPLALIIPGSVDNEARCRLSQDAESELMESTQSVKVVLVPDAVTERAVEKAWEEPETEVEKLQSRLRALERKLKARELELAKTERLISMGEKDPTQLLISPVYHEETSGLTWNTTEEEDQTQVDTEL